MDWISATSYWHATPSVREEEQPVSTLTGEVESDVVIVGAGITGLTTALHLQSAGLRVVVLEAGRVGAGTTGGTTGHLDAVPDQGAQKLIEQWGEASSRLVTRARRQAIDQIEAWSRDFGIACDFHRVPAWLYSESASGPRWLAEEHDAIRQLGLNVQSVSTTGLPWVKSGGLKLEGQGRLHGLLYVEGLAREFRKNGGGLYEHTRARPPSGNHEKTIETDHGAAKASRAMILCTHSAYLGLSHLDLRVAPYQSYVIAVRVADDIPDALYWDNADPYHYLRRASANDPHLLIVGGSDHKTGQGGDEREPLKQLKGFVAERLTVEKFEYEWSAEFFEPADGLPYIGSVPRERGLYVATGFSGTGLTFGTVAGQVLANLVLERSDPLAEVLTPARIKPLAAAGRLLAENLNVVHRFVSDRFTTPSIKSLSEIETGTGRLVRYQGRPLAAFRDEAGCLHTLSPVCTHAGCFVQWNDFERTWDCPCHGGRFSAIGERLYGPPARDLEVKSLPDS